MDKTAFWQQKLIQFFHDPPAKPYFRYGRSKWFEALVQRIMGEEDGNKLLAKKSLKGHKRIAAALYQAQSGMELKYTIGAPDWCAGGADRPLLYARNRSDSVNVYWSEPANRIIVHPLAEGYQLQVEPLLGDDDLTRRELAQSLLEAEMEVAADQDLPHPVWDDPEGLEVAFVTLWRRFRDELIARRNPLDGRPGSDPLWEEMPADSRCPDHSIWDHLRVTTALAFLKPHRMNERAWLDNQWSEGAREPWLLRFSIGPAQGFIAEARTGRDLWTGSMLLAELAWAAMQPFVERYGPDCILYPDLRANPRVDTWLYDAYPDALRPGANPSSFAAILPNAFVVLVPKGGAGHLESLETLAAAATHAVTRHWAELAAKVRAWLESTVGQGAWTAIWDRQLKEPPLYCIWTAVPWLPLGCIQDPEHLLGRALPVQKAGFRAPKDPAGAARDRQVMNDRTARLRPWVPPEVWALYERTRYTYAASKLEYHQMERGFDYALTHHQLSARHALRKRSYPVPENALADEHGEKCTLCGKRQALTNAGGTVDGLDHLRQQARDFWRRKALDPDETGAERLCGVCTLKRFLVTADQDDNRLVFNHVWAGTNPEDRYRDRDEKLRVPFPSTATVAAQRFIAAVLKDTALRPQLDALLAACDAAGLERTSFARSLPRLAAQAAGLTGALRAFLEYEPEDLLFPDAIEGKARGLRDRAGRAPDAAHLVHRADALGKVAAASRDLLKTARKRWTPSRQGSRERPAEPTPGFGLASVRNVDQLPTSPGTQIAVIRMDGDRMGRLLLGDADSIATRWRDVIHPDAVAQLKDSESLQKAGWGDLLDAKRLMGPSLHAFVTRALGHFGHRIVPWVVEMEFSGRLIYAGGDDLLCLAPADEALDLAARLQQLYSAAWVVDTDPSLDLKADPWAWRHRDWQGSYDQDRARRRFAIPLMGPDKAPIRLPVERGDLLEPHSADTSNSASLPVEGPLLPMLGRGVSLSAGIAFGHYKTPLSVLLARSQALLKFAKEPDTDGGPPPGAIWTGRRALAVGHASRGGEKTRFALPWNGPDDAPDESPRAHRAMTLVRDAFRDGGLSSRLPYKLRERAPAVQQALQEIAKHPLVEPDEDDREERLLRGLLRTCLGGPEIAQDRQNAALALWRQGIRLHPNDPDRYTDGLLFCRALAGGGDSEGEGP